MPAFLLPYIAAIGANLLKYAIIGGTAAAVVGGIWIHGYGKGKANVQRKWDAAIKQSVKVGETARAKAESRVASPSFIDRLSNDRFDRDGK